MKFARLAALALCGALLSGCATNDPGPAPTDYKEQIAQFIRANFYDPYSLQDVAIGTPVFQHGLARSSWAVCFQANAKNRFGGYAGLRLSVYTFRNGQLDVGDIDAYIVPDACAPGILKPWPELLLGPALPSAAAPAILPPMCWPLGVHLQPVDASDPVRATIPTLRGVRVLAVDPDSPADKVAIMPGDIISTFNARPIANCDDLQAAIKAVPRSAPVIPVTGVDAHGLQWFHSLTPDMLVEAAGKQRFEQATAQARASGTTLPGDSMRFGILAIPLAPSHPAVQRNHSLKGVQVAYVAPGSPAALAGIKAGDVVTSFDGRPVSSAETLRDALAAAGSKPSIAISVAHWNPGPDTTVTLTLPVANANVEPVPGPDPSRQLGLHGDTDLVTTPGTNTKGALITKVDPGTIADQAGLRAGDIIIACNGAPITDTADIQKAASAIHDHGSFTVLVYQPDTKKLTTVTLGR